MAGIIVIFFLKDKKLSPNTAQISEHINSSNKKNHSYDQMRKFIVNLGRRIFKNNHTSPCQLTHLQNLLLVSIVDTPENDLSNVIVNTS